MDKKTTLKTILTAALLLLCFAVQAQTWQIGWPNAADVTATFDESTGTFTISGTGAMRNFSPTTAAPWNNIRTSIQTVIIDDGVTTIGDRAFQGATGLTSVTIPNSVTTIGDWAFWGCTGLTSAVIGNGVTRIGQGAFQNTGLTSITIPASVTTIGILT